MIRHDQRPPTARQLPTLESKIDSFERFDRAASKFGSPPSTTRTASTRDLGGSIPPRQAGVSLSFGARVFEDADYLLIPTFREEDGEDRYKVIGMVDGKFWTAVHVRHGDTVRFISVRRSNDGEEKQYLA